MPYRKERNLGRTELFLFDLASRRKDRICHIPVRDARVLLVHVSRVDWLSGTFRAEVGWFKTTGAVTGPWDG